MAAADLLCKFTNLFGGLTGLHHRQAAAVAQPQGGECQHDHHDGFNNQEDVNRLGVIPVMVVQGVEQNRAKQGRAEAKTDRGRDGKTRPAPEKSGVNLGTLATSGGWHDARSLWRAEKSAIRGERF